MVIKIPTTLEIAPTFVTDNGAWLAMRDSMHEHTATTYPAYDKACLNVGLRGSEQPKKKNHAESILTFQLTERV